jgi:hypothetical protein
VKPHPRIRKTLKRAGVAVTVALFAIWVVSAWYCIGWGSPEGSFAQVAGGCCYIGHFERNARLLAPLGWQRGRWNIPFEWWCWSWRSGKDWVVIVPLWVPAIGALVLTAVPWRLDALARRRARAGLCPKCRYDLRGLSVGAPCPECGGVRAAGTHVAR